MTIVTLNEYIKQIALTIPIIHSYSNQSPYEYWNTSDVKYGSVIFAVKSVKTQNNIAKYDCVLYYGDRLNETGSNRDSVQSDAIGVLENIVNRLNESDRVEYVTYPVQSTLFEQKFTDNLAGAHANITIDLPATANACDYNLLNDYYTRGEIDGKLDELVVGDLDLSDYYTKAQIDKKLGEIEEGDIDLTNYYTKAQIDNKGYLTSIPKEYVTESELAAKKYISAIPSEYVTESELEERLKDVDVDLTGVATESWVEGKGYLNSSEVDKKIEDAVLKEVDLSSYYTKQQIDNKGFITSIPSEYVTESELESKGYISAIPTEYVTESELESKGYLTREDVGDIDVDLSDYYTKEQIDGKNFVTNGDLVMKGYATKEEVQTEVSKIDLTDYYKKGESDSKYQPKGSYLTSIPSEYVTETELSGKGYATQGYVDRVETQLSTKQPQLVSGTNIKTINGESILGSGNIEIKGGSGSDVDLSDYYTKSQSDSKYQPKGSYLTSIPSEYVTETELENRLKDIDVNVDLTDYYTKAEINELVGAVNQVLGSLINDIDTEALEVQLNDILNKE